MDWLFANLEFTVCCVIVVGDRMINKTQFVLVEELSALRACAPSFKYVHTVRSVSNLGQSSVDVVDSGVATYPGRMRYRDACYNPSGSVCDYRQPQQLRRIAWKSLLWPPNEFSECTTWGCSITAKLCLSIVPWKCPQSEFLVTWQPTLHHFWYYCQNWSLAQATDNVNASRVWAPRQSWEIMALGQRL